MTCRGSLGRIFPLGVLEPRWGAWWACCPYSFCCPSWRPFYPFLFGLDPLVLCRSETPQLFTVLPEKRTATVGGAMMGSTHIYDMSTVSTWRILLLGAGKGGQELGLLSFPLEMTRL